MCGAALSITLAYSARDAHAQGAVLTNGANSASNNASSGTQAGTSTHAAALAGRATHAPAIDGSAADDAWRKATPITAFRVFDPTEDADPAFATEARITYDATCLYVLVRAFDPQPDSIIALLSRRDVKTTSDQIKVLIDSYHDRRTGYEFAVNPAGVKRDYYTYDDAAEDVSWNGVWEVGTQIDSLGWTAEFRIPLSQLRYAAAPSHTFGVMIMRDVARRNERYSWPVYRRSRPGIASQFAEVAGFEGLGSPRRIELSPYVLTRNESVPRTEGFGRAEQSAIGADLKYGITSNLTLDATINPDFGQVEADPATVNLTAFETFLEEQRPFFLEGTGIFQFGDDPTALFYSRRIGRAPQLSGLVSDPVADIPGASRIVGAGKLTGRLSDGVSLGVLGAATERVRVGTTAIEPATTYAVARATRDFRGGESALGVMVTGVHRSLDAASERLLRGDALTLGVDGRHRFAQGAYSVRGSFATSSVRGTSSAIARTQRGSVHLYQRSDAGLALDTSRTSLSGTSLSLTASKLSGLVHGAVQYLRTSPGYETNDLGFLSRADLQYVVAQMSLVPSKPVSGWRNASLGFDAVDQFTASGMRNGSTIEAVASGYRANGARVSIDSWVDNPLPTYCDRCARGGPALRLSPVYNTLVNLSADPKRRVSPTFAAIYTLGDGGRSMLWRVRPYVVVRPSTRVSVELGTRYQRNRDNTQWLATLGDVAADSAHHLFAHLDQDLLSFTGRLDVTVRPTLSLQMYAEPFVTAGRYTNVRELRAPRAASYDDRFVSFAGVAPDGDFNEKSFNASAVLRWEYRPASTLFVVWTQARDQSDRDLGAFSATRDYRNLFAARPANVFLVKAAYWVGR
ncbi:MAG TPA: DUF5916 domain-containing protein [Gemmatimonadaceae bacterium]|nr:DUF5916 domain-containing protein [Gemmatimonadaceae bacterium]